MDVGSVRMTERHLRSDPPTAAEVAACVADVDAALAAAGVDPLARGESLTVEDFVRIAEALPQSSEQQPDQPDQQPDQQREERA